MTSNIVDLIAAVHAQNKKRMEASERYEGLVQERVQQKAEMIKNVSSWEEGEDLSEEMMAQRIYYRFMSDYGSHSISIPKLEMSPRERVFWKRVVKCSKDANTGLEDYLKAQFSYFHRIFKKAPEYKHLTTPGAILRAKEEKVTQRKIIGSVEDKQNLAELFAECNKQLLTVQKAQKMTREQVYIQLVLPGHLYFPETFLNADPVYRKAKAEHG